MLSVKVRVWLDHLAPPNTSSEGELDIKLHSLALHVSSLSIYMQTSKFFLFLWHIRSTIRDSKEEKGIVTEQDIN